MKCSCCKKEMSGRYEVFYNDINGDTLCENCLEDMIDSLSFRTLADRLGYERYRAEDFDDIPDCYKKEDIRE